jgi:sulfur-carrier protein adenylyltransferase/sulfurtransferase
MTTPRKTLKVKKRFPIAIPENGNGHKEEATFDYQKAFGRNLGFVSESEQEILRLSHVAIVGLGGTGGAQAAALARMGVGRFTLCDLDTFELSNFNRQFGASVLSLGKSKTETTKAIIQAINPEAEVRLFEKGLAQENIDFFLEGVDLVMDSLDFYAFKERFLLYRTVREKKIWVVNVAPPGFGATLLAFDPNGMSFEDYFDFNPETNQSDLEASMILGINPTPFVLKYMDRSRLNAQTKGLPCVAPAFFLVGGVAATEAYKILTHKTINAVPWVTQFDAYLQTSKKRYYPWGMKSPIQKLKKYLIKQTRSQQALSPVVPSSEDTKNPSLTPQIKNIVKAALMSPSGDNSQPWQYFWDGKELRIEMDQERARHALNRANHASLLSLGCVMESIAIAAPSLGLMPTFEHEKKRLQAEPHVIVTFEPIKKKKEPLHRILFLRTTDRRLFRGGSLKDEIFSQVTQSIQEFSSHRLHFTDQYSSQLLNYMSAADCFVLYHKDVHRDLFKWLRFSDRKAEKLRDGLPWRNLGMNYMESRVLAMCKDYKIQDFFNKLVFGKQIKKNAEKAIMSSAALGCITVSLKKVEDLITAGRIWMRVWCHLTAKGYGVQPMTSGVFPIYDLMTGALDLETLREDYAQLFKGGYGILKESFGFAEDEIPVMLFRTGLITPLPAKAKTFRLPLSQVLHLKNNETPSEVSDHLD